jgi:hypothetical protein
MTIDYYYLIQRAIRKRVQLFQGRPGQTHPLDRVLNQLKPSGINRQTQISAMNTQSVNDIKTRRKHKIQQNLNKKIHIKSQKGGELNFQLQWQWTTTTPQQGHHKNNKQIKKLTPHL